MSEVAIGTVMLFAALAILMIIRIPIAFSLAISAMITATYLGIPYFNLFQKMSVSLISFTFIAVRRRDNKKADGFLQHHCGKGQGRHGNR